MRPLVFPVTARGGKLGTLITTNIEIVCSVVYLFLISLKSRGNVVDSRLGVLVTFLCFNF